MKTLGALVAALCVLAFGTAARAQETPTPEDRALARQYFEAGARAYFDGDYPRAIVEFKKAYAHVEDPLILYNVSLAYLKLGNVADAVAAARSTARIADGLAPDDRVRFEARWAGLGRAVLAEEIAAAAATRAEEPPDRDVVAVRSQPEQALVRTRLGSMGVVGAALGLVGAGTLVTAGLVDAMIGPDLATFRDAAAAGDARTYDELAPSLRRRQTVVKVLLGTGAALATAGVVLFVVDYVTVTERLVPVAWLAEGGPRFGLAYSF